MHDFLHTNTLLELRLPGQITGLVSALGLIVVILFLAPLLGELPKVEFPLSFLTLQLRIIRDLINGIFCGKN